MCDENFEHDLETYSRFPHMNRRQFGGAAMGAGVMAMLPRAADAQQVKEQDVTITTPDGTCDAYFVHPASGASAAVIVLQPISSGCAQPSARWASAWRNPATPC